MGTGPMGRAMLLGEKRRGTESLCWTETWLSTPNPWGAGVWGGGRSQKACLLLRSCPSPFSGSLPFIYKLSAKQDGTNSEGPTLMPPGPLSQFSLLTFSLFSSRPHRSTSSDRHMPTPVLSTPRPPSSLRYTELRSWHAHTPL